MKTILFLTILTQLALPQSSKLLLLMDEDAVNTGTVLLDSLKAYWNMSDANDSYSNNNLTNSGVSFVAGKVGNCGDFESSELDYMSITNNANLDLNGNTDFTISSWFKLESANGTDPRGLITKSATVSMREWYLIGHSGTGFNRASFTTSTDGSTTTSATTATNSVQVGNWYMIIAWHNATTDSIYIQINNGSVYQSAFSTGIYNGTGAFTIGKLFTSVVGYYWDGLVDEVAFWKRTLTASERTYLYNNGNGRTYVGGKIQ